MPFSKGEDFELYIFITSKGYQVYVNGRQFYLFVHRMPVDQVNTLEVTGDVSVQTINIIRRGPRGVQGQPGLGKVVVSKIPHVGPVFGGLRTGMYLYFRGTIPEEIDRFSINLQYGQMKGCDIAMHFNPRFKPSAVVVFNTFRNDSWEKEERVDEMPFNKGKDFELLFIITAQGYQVIVNGRQFYLFKHRMAVEQKIPHVGPVYGGLRMGMVLFFRGTVPQNIKSFHINFQCGELDGCDKAMHFNPRFKPSAVVVFNTFRNGRWEKEEKVNEMPFEPGQSFELAFIVTSKGYQVKVNGHRFYMFNHRMPVEYVSALQVAGDISMETADITEGGGDEQDKEKEEKKVIPSIPDVGPIYGGLRPGMSLYFSGTIPQEIKRFSINLHCGEDKGCDNAFHFNPRFEPSEVVVFNTVRKGSWEKEERVDVMPFERGEEFEMVINVTLEGYQVIVNDSELYLFKHRIQMEDVTAIKIFGDVYIQTTNIIEGGQGAVQGGLGLGKMVVDPSEVVVFNTSQNGQWQKEEKVGVMPFRQGEEFELVFIITSVGYQVLVNGRRFYMFKHRIPVEQVSVISIGGDVSMKTINMIGGGIGGIQGYQGLRKMAVTRIPHVGPVYGGLRKGMYLYFRGTVPQVINRFLINLQYGQMNGSDIAMHFNPRFQTNEVVVFNTFRNGKWEKEETVDKMPFKKGEEFELVFIITAEGYQVIVNGRQFHLFKHRMPVQHVSAIKIAGDVTMQHVNMTGGGEVGVPGRSSGQMIVAPSIPHVGPVYGGLRSGMYLRFKGTVPQEIKRFNVNLQYGQLEGCDIAFHINPRFETQEVVVFNTFRNGSWETEERVDEMPFTKGEKFEMVVIVTPEAYQVYINGRQFHSFKHRMPVKYVSVVKIGGDISIQTVAVNEGGVPGLPDPRPRVVSTTPHVEPIDGGLRTGMYLYFKGTILQEIKSFAINLQYGEIKGCDNAFQFNPRFDPSEVVVFNSFRNGSWETEERVDKMPFVKGEDFEVVFIITSEGYQVNVNGRQFHFFKHRMVVDQVSAIKIVGDVSMKDINIIQGGPGSIQGLPGQGKIVISSIPHVVPTYGGLRTGMYLYFKGTVPQEIKSFAINLQYGEIEGCDKAFHFNPRFDPAEVVVFNSFRNGSWETEEKVEDMPFIKGEEFEMVFIITPEGYQVNINGRQFHFFKHRMPVVHGAITEEMIGFTINLQYGEMEGCNKAFHINARFEPSWIVAFNSFCDGEWGEEEIASDMPFEQGESFEMVFIITVEGYQVIVNGRRFYMFKHRMPVNQVSALKISGSILIETVNMLGAGDVEIQEKPEKEAEPERGDVEIQEEPEKEAEPEIIPDVEPISGGLKTGMAVCFRGTIPHEITSFAIDLQCGETKGCDTAFRFNPQFEPSEAVVFNSFKDGSWETEERVDDMPFTKGESFDLMFLVTSESYQVFVNSRRFYSFKHRIPVDQVSSVQITGEVSMQTTNYLQEEEVDIEEEPVVDDTEVIQTVSPLPGGLKIGMSMSFQGMIPNELTRGESFLLVFILTSEGYQVFVNGQQLYLFKYRMAVEQVSVLRIVGDVSIQTTEITEVVTVVVEEEEEVEETETVQSETPVPGSLKTGTTLSFQGTIPNETTRFSINLQCGETEGCDTAFHFSPQFETSDVVFNTFQNGSWETEERVDKMPFNKGEKLDLVYIITLEGYQVNVNGAEFYMYKHRIPVDKVRALQITGDISIQTTNIIEEMVQEYPRPTELGTIQYKTPIPGSLETETTLTFQGSIPDEITSFSINLQCGETDGCDTAFHFSPQFKTSDVVFNTFQNGSWGTEERVDKMPFSKGEKFEIVYIITSEGYQVNVNGTAFYMFKHRIPLEQVKALQIAGDVIIKIATIEEPVPEYPSPAKLGTVQSVTPVPDSLKMGMSMAFQGTIPDNITRFCINLQCGVTEGCDTALHFSLLFETSEVLFNTYRNGSWEEPEKVNEMPFHKGEKFVLVFIITSEGYQVTVNGIDFYLFKHRIALEKVSSLQIIGDISIVTVSVVEETVPEYPSPAELGPIQSVTPIPSNLTTEMTMSFEGSIPDDITRFSINLQCGETEGCDTAFHFSPQFKSSEVVFNTYRNGSWEEPEKVNEMPFHKGESFLLLFNITTEGYQVKVNGNELHMFKHRIPVDQVRALQIIGDVGVKAISIIQTTPSVTPLPGGLKMGTSVTFLGTVPNESTSFSIDLQCGTTDGCDTAFQFNPQFEPSQAVVFNSFQSGSWETEEKVTEMPFIKGENFELVFNVTPDGYQVDVNGEKFYLFKHRISVDRVRALQISGNVNMPTINIIEGGFYGGMPESAQWETVMVTSAPTMVPIPGGFKMGSSVNFKLSIPQEIPSFSIDLQCGETEGCNKALRFNPQFEPAGVVVFNSFSNGSWEQEESVTEMPFIKGESCDLVFDITTEGYQVKVNGSDLYMFKHRIPVEQVNTLLITGDISMEGINIIEVGEVGMQAPSCFGQMEVTGSLGGEQWTCGVGEQQEFSMQEGPI
ncbi:hypothetical protein SKAU_G00087280 [Synaphobranchus kaupii]|uniref:Galectin domain-containing protein n=1 Tax=Synaphobranchus kaupii TaxID=118154 RepID=A0A9Q1J3W7_SYNKA|nr:hypothetical protein SKAU_G00087280 [Synaphobranchus kaupii]